MLSATLPIAQHDPEHDVVAALDRWVEKGTAPDQIIATGFDGDPAKGVVMTRPLCPYPEEAVYKGTGDTNSAANFSCKNRNKDRSSDTARVPPALRSSLPCRRQMRMLDFRPGVNIRQAHCEERKPFFKQH